MTFSLGFWSDALRLLQEDIPDFVFQAWIAPLEAKLAEDRLILGCPTSFHRDRIRLHHLGAIEHAWQAAIEAQPAGAPAAGSIDLLTMVEFAEAPGLRIEPRLGMRSVGSVSQAQVVNAGAPQRAPTRRPPLSGPSLGDARPGAEKKVDPERPRLHALPAAVAGKAAARVRNDTVTTTPLTGIAHARRAEPRADRGPGFGLDGEPHNTRDEPFSFETFIVGPANALAREATLALARRRQRSLNLLYLAGLPGMGKTHLARAAAEEARRQLASYSPAPGGTRGRVLYTTAEQFTSEFVSAMRNGRNEAWTRRYRGPIELLVVEDIHHLTGRTKTQQELSQTIAHVLDAGGRVLLTSDRAPRDLSGLDERLGAQVGRGFIAELDRPDAIVRRHILRAKAAAGGVQLPPDCVDLLVEATGRAGLGEGSVRDVEGLLIQVVTTASLLARTIDRALVQEAIDVKRGAGVELAPRRLSIAEIVRIVAGFFGKRPEALASRSRRRDVLVPRQLAMYLAHRYTDASLTEIGRALNRDHPSVSNAIQRIDRQVLENAPVRYQVEALFEKIDAVLTHDGIADREDA